MSSTGFFVCLDHGTRQYVGTYDYDNPPTCPTCSEVLIKEMRVTPKKVICPKCGAGNFVRVTPRKCDYCRSALPEGEES